MTISFRHLKQIEALERHSHFARAATELGISQPALSRAIATLEDQLSVKLFDRSKSGVFPTSFGQRILKSAQPILRDMKILKRDFSQYRNIEEGEISIGYGPFGAEISLGAVLKQLSHDFPKLHVDVRIDNSEHLLTNLRKGLIDLFVADCRVLDSLTDLKIKRLSSHQGYFCCRPDHPIMELTEPGIDEIFNYPIAMTWIPLKVLELLAAETEATHEELKKFQDGIIRCDYLNILYDVIAESDAIGVSTKHIMMNPSYCDRCVLLPMEIPALKTDYGIVTLKERSLPPGIDLVMKYIFEVEEQIAVASQ